MATLGIDLGTTASLAAYITRQKVPALIPDKDLLQAFQTPFAVGFCDGCALVGRPLEDLLLVDPAYPMVRFRDLQLASKTTVLTDDLERGWSSEAVVGILLKKLGQDAERLSHESVSRAVVATPGSFGAAERERVERAAVLAGYPSPVVVTDAEAVAVYHGLERSDAPTNFLIYDLGGEVFGATLFRATREGLEVLSAASRDTGSRSLEDALMEGFAEEIVGRRSQDPLSDPVSRVQLRRVALQVKLKLAGGSGQPVRQSVLLAGEAHDFVVTARQFYAMLEPLLRRSLAACQECLETASLSWKDLEHVVLAGGGSQMAFVIDRVARAAGRSPGELVRRNVVESAAFGAAVLAARLGEDDVDTSAPRSHDRMAFDLGLTVFDEERERRDFRVLIEKGTPLPARCDSTFYTTTPEQRRMLFHVVRSETSGERRELGRFAFGPIEKPRKNYPVELELSCSREGTIRLRTRDAWTGTEVEEELQEESQVESARLSREMSWLSDLRINE